jgi:hypothetical protein
MIALGAQLSPVGSEILSLIRAQPSQDYISLFGQALSTIGAGTCTRQIRTLIA